MRNESAACKRNQAQKDLIRSFVVYRSFFVAWIRNWRPVSPSKHSDETYKHVIFLFWNYSYMMVNHVYFLYFKVATTLGFCNDKERTEMQLPSLYYIKFTLPEECILVLSFTSAPRDLTVGVVSVHCLHIKSYGNRPRHFYLQHFHRPDARAAKL